MALARVGLKMILEFNNTPELAYNGLYDTRVYINPENQQSTDDCIQRTLAALDHCLGEE